MGISKEITDGLKKVAGAKNVITETKKISPKNNISRERNLLSSIAENINEGSMTESTI